MDTKTITAMICSENPFVDYFAPLLYSKEDIEHVNVGFNDDMLGRYKSTSDIQSYNPRTSRWCLLMFLVEAFKTTEAHVRKQCIIDEEDFPDLDLVPYMRFCHMLGYKEISSLTHGNFDDFKYIRENYLRSLKRAFNKSKIILLNQVGSDFEYTLDIILFKDGRFADGGMTITISSDIT